MKPQDCSNRTFMELKFAMFYVIYSKLRSSNRTFMELKLLFYFLR